MNFSFYHCGTIIIPYHFHHKPNIHQYLLNIHLCFPRSERIFISVSPKWERHGQIYTELWTYRFLLNTQTISHIYVQTYIQLHNYVKEKLSASPSITTRLSGRRELMVMWNNIIPFNDHEWFYYVTISYDVVNRTMANKFGRLLANVPSSWYFSSLIICASIPRIYLEIVRIIRYTHGKTSIFIRNITLILVTTCSTPFHFYLHTFFNLITTLAGYIVANKTE